MRARNLVITIFLLTVFTACTSSSAYRSSAKSLSTDEQLASHLVYMPVWVPLDKEIDYEITKEERITTYRDLEDCASLFGGRGDPAPRREIRTVHLINCMKEKGWQPYIEEILIMR